MAAGGRWSQRQPRPAAGILDELLGRVAGQFARVEPCRRAGAFLGGLLADLPRKTCWSLAEHAGEQP